MMDLAAAESLLPVEGVLSMEKLCPSAMRDNRAAGQRIN